MSRAIARAIPLLVVGLCVLMLARHNGGLRRNHLHNESEDSDVV